MPRLSVETPSDATAQRRRLVPRAWVCATAFVAACALPPPPDLVRQEGPIWIVVDAPEPGARLRQRTLRIPVRGTARLEAPRAERPLDVFLVVDASEATARPSGLDVDGDGEVGFDPHRILSDLEPGGLVCTDPEDSILHAQVAAVRRLLDHLEGSAHRVGLGFVTDRASDTPTGDAMLPLTARFADLHAGLDRVLAGEQAAGAPEDGLRAGFQALEAGRPGARRILAVLRATGEPTRSGTGRADIEVHSFAVARARADARKGAPRPLWPPTELIAALTGGAAGDTRVAIHNLSLGATASDAFVARDGRLSGWIPVQEGPNRLQIALHRADGRTGTARFEVEVERDLPSHWELLQGLEELRRRNQELIYLIEGRGIRERGPGELEIRVDPES